jgi:probable rRNA maturation factor
MILNRQDRVRVDMAGARAFAARLAAELKLGTREFNVCFVDDEAIRELNGAFRKKPYATDVLSFAWKARDSGLSRAQNREFGAFLGDVVISVETAGRNARAEGHSTAAEIRWLIMHGVLHLLGMDHETDHGEMEARELDLRVRLGLNGSGAAKKTRRSESRRRDVKRASRSRISTRKRGAGSPQI